MSNALVWQDTRVGDVENFAATGGPDRFRSKTGLPLGTYFSGLKMRWMLENRCRARERAEAGEMLFGNIDTFLVWHLTGGAARWPAHHRVTNASRTQLMNLQDLAWDDGCWRIRNPASDVAANTFEQRSVRRRKLARFRACRSPEFWATSRPRWWGRHVSKPARPRTPTAPAASC